MRRCLLESGAQRGSVLQSAEATRHSDFSPIRAQIDIVLDGRKSLSFRLCSGGLSIKFESPRLSKSDLAEENQKGGKCIDKEVHGSSKGDVLVLGKSLSFWQLVDIYSGETFSQVWLHGEFLPFIICSSVLCNWQTTQLGTRAH